MLDQLDGSSVVRLLLWWLTRGQGMLLIVALTRLLTLSLIKSSLVKYGLGRWMRR